VVAQRVVTVGAGRCAREVQWLFDEINAKEKSSRAPGYVVTGLERLPQRNSRQGVLGGHESLSGHMGEFDAVGIGIRRLGARLMVSGDLTRARPNLDWLAFTHPRMETGRARAQGRSGRGPAVWECRRPAAGVPQDPVKVGCKLRSRLGSSTPSPRESTG